jgi:spermidine/putrescine transport system permease protein
MLKHGFLTLVYGFLYLPILILVVYSFNETKYVSQWGEFSFVWYTQLFNNTLLLQATFNSLLLATLSATGATLIGTLAAVGLFRYHFRNKPLIYGLLYSVVVSPDIVTAISLLILFIILQIKLGLWSLLLAHITLCLPFVVMTILSRLNGFDKNIIEAAQDLGADEFHIFLKIVLPLLIPVMIAVWLLSFTLSLDDVIISFFVTGPDFEILPLKIYSMVRLGVKPEVNALCTLILGLSLIFVFIAQLLLKNHLLRREVS